MPAPARKTELSPLEAIVVETTLGELARSGSRESTLVRIQQLTKERQKLYAKSAAHPFTAVTNGPRIRTISMEIELLWDTLRRERATQRVQLERALNVVCEDESADREDDHAASHNSSDAA
jgi:hypothetical protein